MESSWIKQYEISSLRIYFNIIADWLFNLILFRENVPVIFMIQLFLLLKVLMMIPMCLWNSYKSSTIWSSISQSHNSLIAPHIVFSGWLICMQERIILDFFIVSSAIHEAEAIKWCFHWLTIPKFLKKWFTQFSQLPLRLGVTNVLNHPPMKHRRIVLAQDLCGSIIP